jgi:hypothetical protein
VRRQHIQTKMTIKRTYYLLSARTSVIIALTISSEVIRLSLPLPLPSAKNTCNECKFESISFTHVYIKGLPEKNTLTELSIWLRTIGAICAPTVIPVTTQTVLPVSFKSNVSLLVRFRSDK